MNAETRALAIRAACDRLIYRRNNIHPRMAVRVLETACEQGETSELREAARMGLLMYLNDAAIPCDVEA